MIIDILLLCYFYITVIDTVLLFRLLLLLYKDHFKIKTPSQPRLFMNYTEDPFHSSPSRHQLFHKDQHQGKHREDRSESTGADSLETDSSGLKSQLQEQDFHLDHLQRSLRDARLQTDALHNELKEHNELLGRLGTRMDDTEGAFETASRRVKRLYTEITDRKFTWTAGVLIFVLTILLMILLFT